MYSSNPSGIGIPSPFDAAPSSVHTGSNLMDDACPSTFNWLTQFTGQTSALSNDHSAASSIKIGSDDPTLDCPSFMNFDHHTGSFSRGGNNSLGMDSFASQQQQQQQQQMDGGGAITGPFHPYHPTSDSISAAAAGMAHPSLSSSHFAAFDSVYKTYQNAFGSGGATATAASLFGNQPYRYDSSMMAAEQQMLLQASMLQYPHMGFFPHAAMYPNLQSGFRNSMDYYCQNMAGLSLLSKYQDLAAINWLGADKLSASSSLIGEREKEEKDYESHCEQAEHGKRSEKDVFEHHRMRHDRDERQHESKVEESQKEHGRSSSSNGASRHFPEKSFKNEPMKQSAVLKSPTKHEHRHSESNPHKISASQSSYSFPSSRLHSFVSRASLAEPPLNLQKPVMSPGGVNHQQQKHTVSSKHRDLQRQFDLPQPSLTTKERLQATPSRTDDVRDKRGIFAVNLSKPASTMGSALSSPLKAQFEPRFHRPFEQLCHGFSSSEINQNDTHERHFEPPAYATDRPYNHSKASPAPHGRDNILRAVSDDRGGGFENRNLLRYHQHHRYQHQQHIDKTNGKKALTSSVNKRRLSDTSEELPLNLAVSKVALLDCSASVARRESEPGPVRFQSNSGMHESLIVKVENNHAKKKMVGRVGQSNSAGCKYRAKNSSSGHSDTCKISDQQRLAVSKLDLMAATKSVSTNGKSVDCIEETDELGISQEAAKHLLITSGPPMAEEISPHKLRFLKQFDLVPIDVSKELKFKQRQRRHRLMREFSISPVQLNVDAVESIHFDSALPNTDRSVDRPASADKDALLCALQLQSIGILADSENNGCQEQPSLSTKAVKPYSLHQNSKLHRRPPEVSTVSLRPKKQSAKCDTGHEEQKSVVGSDPHSRMLSLNESEKFQQFSSTSGTCNTVCDLPSAFALTTSQQKRQLPARRESADDSFSLTDATKAERLFQWPGHEVVTESYYHYIEETTMERELIRKQNQRFHRLNSDLTEKLRQLQSHMTGLLEMKDVLTENQFQLQSKVDGLKSSIKAFQ